MSSFTLTESPLVLAPITTPLPIPVSKKNKVIVLTKTGISTSKKRLISFVGLLVTAFAVASGVAWKDCVVSWFQKGGPLGFLNLGPFFFAMSITIVGALLTVVSTHLKN